MANLGPMLKQLKGELDEAIVVLLFCVGLGLLIGVG